MTYVILLSAVAAGVATGLLLYLRSHPARGRAATAPVDATAADAGAAQPSDAAPGPPCAPVVVDLPLLQRRVHAIVLDAPALVQAPQAVEGVHAQVLAQCQGALERLQVQPRHLPRRPQLLPQLTRAVNDPDASFRGIAAIIAQDPALAANLLRIANSALYRPGGQPVQDIERAVALVGSEGVRRIVVAALMQPVLDPNGGILDRLSAQAWDEALQIAAAAAEHAQRHGQGGDALSAQLLGLLHGLGGVVVLRVLRDAYAAHAGVAPSPQVIGSLLQSHAAAAARSIAGSWELPAAMGEALATQHPATGPLGRALRYGRLAALLAALARAGAQDPEQALAMLATLDADAVANARLWQRLSTPAP